jgi:hypothetical protein
MASFEGAVQGLWIAGEPIRRILPRLASWSCPCPRVYFTDPSTTCNVCHNFIRSFCEKISLRDLRSSVGANCKICSILYSGLMQYHTLWEHIEESIITVRLDVRLEDVVYLSLEVKETTGDSERKSDISSLICLELYTLPRK